MSGADEREREFESVLKLKITLFYTQSRTFRILQLAHRQMQAHTFCPNGSLSQDRQARVIPYIIICNLFVAGMERGGDLMGVWIWRHR